MEAASAMIQIKRAYEASADADGTRLLVERLWPRGIRKTDLVLNDWLKDVAPSQELRLWFHHAPALWPEFCLRYLAELEAKPQTWLPILQAARKGTVTLIYSAHDTEHKSALLLQQFLNQRLKLKHTG